MGTQTAPVTTYAYDGFRQLASVTQPGGGAISYDYDEAGNLISLTDPVGNETTYAYDGVGRLSLETNEQGDWRSDSYDLVGNLVRAGPQWRVIRYNYDGLDQVTSEEWRSTADPGPDMTIETDTQGGSYNEVQRVGYTGTNIMGGTFRLSFAGQTTASISHGATAAQVQTASKRSRVSAAATWP